MVSYTHSIHTYIHLAGISTDKDVIFPSSTGLFDGLELS